MRPLSKFLALLAIAPVSAQAADLPQAIKTRLPKGYEALQFKAGQIGAAGSTGYLVVVHRPEDDRSRPSPRPLLIFTQKPGGGFTLSGRNDLVVMRADEGGQCDPFLDSEDGLAIKNGYFTVQNSVACGEHWSDYITFHYDPAHGDWLFHKEIFNSSDPLNDRPGTTTVKAADKRRPVTFRAWRPTR